MNKWLLIGGLLLIAGTGCLTLPKAMTMWSKDGNESAVEKGAKVKNLKPVTPDQVNEANAHEICTALWDELDRDMAAPVEAPK